MPDPSANLTVYKEININREYAALELADKLDEYSDIIHKAICTNDYLGYKPTAEECHRVVHDRLTDYLPYILYMRELLKYDEDDVKSKAAELDNGGELSECDNLKFLLHRIKLIWALTDYQDAYNYHVCRASYDGTLKNADKGIETYRWITGRAADSWMRSGMDSCDQFGLLVVISICELYNKYMLDLDANPEDNIPLMELINFDFYVQISLLTYKTINL